MWLLCSLYRNEYRNLKLARATIGRGLGRSKRTRRDESVGVVIHTCMETTQGNSLFSCLYRKLGKTLISLFLFYVFSSTKLENRFWWGGVGKS
jgi:hypothetical protein